MDFVRNLTDELNDVITDHDSLTPAQVVTLINRAARATVDQAAGGLPMTDCLDRQELGMLLVALQWNHNPKIRQAVRHKDPIDHQGRRENPLKPLRP